MPKLHEFTRTNMCVFIDPHRSLWSFNEMISAHVTGMPLMCQLDGPCGDDLIRHHIDKFSWHHDDTHRSFTSLKADSKFGYRKRMVRYFGVDLESALIDGDTDVVGIWDPRVDHRQPSGSKPCLMSLSVNQVHGTKLLDMLVTFRARDILRRMIGNWFHLINLLHNVAAARGKQPGRIYDFSYTAWYRSNDLKTWGIE